MNTPNPALMRAYGTDEVFFKKANAGPRVVDQVGRLVLGELFEKLARSAVPGMPAQVPGRLLPAVGTRAALPTPTPAAARTSQSAPLPAAPGALTAPAPSPTRAAVGGLTAPPSRGAIAPVGPLPPAKAPPKALAQAPAKAAPGVLSRLQTRLKPGWKSYAALAGAGVLGYKALGGAKDLTEAALAGGEQNARYGPSRDGYYPPQYPTN